MNGIFYVIDKIGIPNVGLAIILFTIVVYILLMPLTIKQQKFSKLSAKMNPELQAIQAKYKGFILLLCRQGTGSYPPFEKGLHLNILHMAKILTQNTTPIIGQVAKLLGWIMNGIFYVIDSMASSPYWEQHGT